MGLQKAIKEATQIDPNCRLIYEGDPWEGLLAFSYATSGNPKKALSMLKNLPVARRVNYSIFYHVIPYLAKVDGGLEWCIHRLNGYSPRSHSIIWWQLARKTLVECLKEQGKEEMIMDLAQHEIPEEIKVEVSVEGAIEHVLTEAESTTFMNIFLADMARVDLLLLKLKKVPITEEKSRKAMYFFFINWYTKNRMTESCKKVMLQYQSEGGVIDEELHSKVAIIAQVQANDPRDAFILFQGAKERGFTMDSQVYYNLLDACLDLHSMKIVPAVQLVLEADAKGVCKLYTTLVSMLVKRQGLWLLDRVIAEMGDRAPAQIFSLIIKEHVIEERITKAMQIFDRMKEKGHSPDILVYNTLITGFGKEHVETTTKFLKEIKNSNLVPTQATYHGAIRVYLSAGDLVTAFKLKKEMEGRNDGGIMYKLIDWIRPLCLNSHVELAEKLIKVRKSDKPLEENVYNYMIIGYSMKQMLKQAEKMLTKMRKLNLKPNLEACKALLNAYINENQVDKAVLLVADMEETRMARVEDILSFAQYRKFIALIGQKNVQL
jgi:pentatricopeptide repeat protein